MLPSKPVRINAGSAPQGETAAKLTALRAELRRIERDGWSGKTGEPVALGLPAIDRLLSGESLSNDKVSLKSGVGKSGVGESGIGGLRRGCLHEFSGEGAEAFAAILAGRLKGPVLWCADLLDGSALYPPGLAAFGLDYRRLILVGCRKPREILAAMEEGLRCRALIAVVGELSGGVDLTASRRLQLAAENSGVTAFLVRSAWRDQVSKAPPAGHGRDRKEEAVFLRSKERGLKESGLKEREPSAAFSRWSVNAARSGDAQAGAIGAATWRLSLLRCRNGGRGAWMVKWDAKTYRFSLAAEAADGQADPPPEPSSGRRLVG